MSIDDKFWSLDSDNKIESQSKFYQHMKISDHLKDTTYLPDDLKQEQTPRTVIKKKTFERVSFSKTHISGIIFQGCIFNECLFIDTTIENCKFHKCRFISSNVYKITISQTYIDPLSFSECLDKKKHQNIGVHLYQILLKNSRDEDQIVFERDAQFLFLRWKRFQDAYQISKSWKNLQSEDRINELIGPSVSFFFRWVWEICFGSGIRMKHYLVTVVCVTLLFSALNFCFREEFGLVRSGILITNCIEAVYFTTISLTSLGYGDIVPTTSYGRLFASVQSVFGFFLFAVLASMLFRKVSP